ncbi:hypothetical protein ACWERY_34815 [Streptomyces sp. NPDC004082]|uniref:hypothetical protein n=2 Tax=unclassified Streptomyces TaxID=2593676 RepID=UPI00367EA8DD
MNRISGPSGRAWAALAVPLALILLILSAQGPLSHERSGRLHALGGALKDVSLPGGVTAALSECGSTRSPRPVPRGEGEEPAAVPSLSIGSYEYSGKDPHAGGSSTFTVTVRLDPGPRPLFLPDTGKGTVARGQATIDIQGPRGEGRIASARGLTARVVRGPAGKPVPRPESGVHRFARTGDLALEVELPARAVCPGRSLADVGRCDPGGNRIEDCPVVAVTLADETVRLHRAAEAGFSAPGRFSDRLVAVFYEESVAGA